MCISNSSTCISLIVPNNIIIEARTLSTAWLLVLSFCRYSPKVVRQNRVYKTRKLPQKYYVNWILSRLHNATRRFHDGNSREREETERKDEKKSSKHVGINRTSSEVDLMMWGENNYPNAITSLISSLVVNMTPSMTLIRDVNHNHSFTS